MAGMFGSQAKHVLTHQTYHVTPLEKSSHHQAYCVASPNIFGHYQTYPSLRTISLHHQIDWPPPNILRAANKHFTLPYISPAVKHDTLSP